LYHLIKALASAIVSEFEVHVIVPFGGLPLLKRPFSLALMFVALIWLRIFVYKLLTRCLMELFLLLKKFSDIL